MNSNYGHYAVETAAIIVFVIAPLMLIRHYSTRERQNGDPFGIGWRAIQRTFKTIAKHKPKVNK
ncbi:MAG TPA: hypothetical protein VHX18_13810 [Rhizomicrobium sp.]|jgi:hypothetical protein|nr:hypothetical protein [Rhizomicrobium sp.]